VQLWGPLWFTGDLDGFWLFQVIFLLFWSLCLKFEIFSVFVSVFLILLSVFQGKTSGGRGGPEGCFSYQFRIVVDMLDDFNTSQMSETLSEWHLFSVGCQLS